MGCTKQMANALVSMLGTEYRDFISADQLPDSFDSDITEAYKVTRKKTVCSLTDMSEKRIGYFDVVPEGYIVRPDKDKEHHSIMIFKPDTKGVGHWVSGYAVPIGWKTKSDLTYEEFKIVTDYMGWETVEAKRERAVKRMEEFKYAYDPLTLECKQFRSSEIPDGWVPGMIVTPDKMLRSRIGTERSCLMQCKDEAVRAKINSRLDSLLDMLDNKEYDKVLSDPSISGIYEMDGKRMFLKNWAEQYGIKLSILRKRISYGWELKRALTEKTH